ncbi:hypothetical protein L6452_40641 [Arctium lappa]|uniref:Uncharacterized protein n=1 Tax=Arctium lappa TaxID=4217 RepID=A0ACB8XLV0_ARCLA|nr:hypothetical protein L6452_40641 [Arctium lappa]
MMLSPPFPKMTESLHFFCGGTPRDATVSYLHGVFVFGGLLFEELVLLVVSIAGVSTAKELMLLDQLNAAYEILKTSDGMKTAGLFEDNMESLKINMEDYFEDLLLFRESTSRYRDHNQKMSDDLKRLEKDIKDYVRIVERFEEQIIGFQANELQHMYDTNYWKWEKDQYEIKLKKKEEECEKIKSPNP